METAPLTLAYKHARNATEETKRHNPVAASEEHDLAAAEFAAAAATTGDQEALRVLKLLEAHHKQLGQILKDGKPNQQATVTGRSAATEESSTASQPPRLARAGRNAGGGLSSSYASNIASARGIPSTRQKRATPISPLVSNEHADGAIERGNARSTTIPEQPSSRPSWAPPENVTHRIADSTAPASNSPFSQFYSRFESAISTLTAPLAFASLPLSQPAPPKSDTDTKPQPLSQAPRKVSSKAEASTATLDFSQLISNAALRAVQDNNDSNGYQNYKPHESFLLVPTSGGTMSYADITAANYIDRQVTRQHRREISNASADDFVDASSQILSGSQSFGKVRRPSQGQAQYEGKTMEELHLENVVLRRTLNDTTKRVHHFELVSQQQTAALAQSIRSLTLSPVATPENSRGKTVPVAGGPGSDLAVQMQKKRIEELEDMVKKYDRRLGKREEENIKLKETLGRYREKWEGLKAGAKARREQVGGGDKLRRTNSAATTASEALRVTSIKDTGADVVDEASKGNGM